MINEDEIIDNDEWEVLTPNGWSDFTSIKKTKKTGGIHIIVRNTKNITEKAELICSKNHRIKLLEEKFEYASNLKVGNILAGRLEIIKIKELKEEEIEYFDLLNVEKNNEYYTNGIVSHNCAHIPENVVTELWLSAYPTLSTGGSAIVISTPTNDQTLFYRLWSDAIAGKNEFKVMELPWTVHPERDQDWYDKESSAVRAAKGEAGVQQEFWCKFGTSGDTFISGEMLVELDKNSIAPSERHPSHLEILIWKKPIEGKSYLITADVASGTAEDYSTFCVSELESGEVVCDFKSKIKPQEFAPLLMEIGYYYNTSVICPELNSYGLIVANELIKETSDINGIKGKYPKLYFPKQETLARCFNEPFYNPELNELPGFSTTPTTRPEILAKLDFMMNTGRLKINSSRFVNELKVFKWKNNKPQADKGKNDDLVLAYAINAYLLYTLDAELKPNESKEKPLLDSNSILSMFGGLSMSQKTLNVSSKEMLTHEELLTSMISTFNDPPQLVDSQGQEITDDPNEQPHRKLNRNRWIY